MNIESSRNVINLAFTFFGFGGTAVKKKFMKFILLCLDKQFKRRKQQKSTLTWSDLIFLRWRLQIFVLIELSPEEIQLLEILGQFIHLMGFITN